MLEGGDHKSSVVVKLMDSEQEDAEVVIHPAKTVVETSRSSSLAHRAAVFFFIFFFLLTVCMIAYALGYFVYALVRQPQFALDDADEQALEAAKLTRFKQKATFLVDKTKQFLRSSNALYTRQLQSGRGLIEDRIRAIKFRPTTVQTARGTRSVNLNYERLHS